MLRSLEQFVEICGNCNKTIKSLKAHNLEDCRTGLKYTAEALRIFHGCVLHIVHQDFGVRRLSAKLTDVDQYV